MKKNIKSEDGLRTEYDFRGAVRGKHYRPIQEGYMLKIHKMDGTTEIQEILSEEVIVRLDPDIRQYFHDSETVNQALRSLMTFMNQFSELSKKEISKERPKIE